MARKFTDRSADSKARIENEIRQVAAKLSHRPVAEVVQYLREARGIAADPAFIESLRRKES